MSLVTVFPRLQNILIFTFSSVTGSSNRGLVLKLVGTTLTSLSEQKGVQSFLVEFARGLKQKFVEVFCI